MLVALAPHEILTSAEQRFEQAKSELSAAWEAAHAAAAQFDWLADCPKLKRLEYLIAQIPSLQRQVSEAQAEYDEAYNNILAATPFVPPLKLEEDLRYYRWLQRLDYGYTGNNLMLLEKEFETRQASHNANLQPDIEKQIVAIKERVESCQKTLSDATAAFAHGPQITTFVKDRIHAFVKEQTSEQQARFESARQQVDDARRSIISLFRQALEQKSPDVRIQDYVPLGNDLLRQELNGIWNAYQQRIQQLQNAARQEADDIRKSREQKKREQHEREWWTRVKAMPIRTLVKNLDNVPEQHIDTVIEILLRLPATDTNILNTQVHEFLEVQHARLLRSPVLHAPVVVAYISRLVADRKSVKANDLLNRFPDTGLSTLDCVAAYLRFVNDEPVRLSEETRFQDLSPEDFFLGACYYDSGSASSILELQDKWDYAALKVSFSRSKDQCLHDFKVKGLQPRIAELAFHSVIEQLAGQRAALQMQDLNRKHVLAIVGPWKPSIERHLLPREADWECNGRKFDVKCNLYYPSYKDKIGLRGFLISKPKRVNDLCFPGFVFTDKDDDTCKWVYVGEYQPSCVSAGTDDRVLPFCFKMPDSERFTISDSHCDAQAGKGLLCNHRLRFGWMLATGVCDSVAATAGKLDVSLLHRFVNRCIKTAANTFLEHALWQAVTEITFEACNQYEAEVVNTFLKYVKKMIADRSLPVRLPCLKKGPLLNAWIDDILQPLVDSWHLIRWPTCKKCDKSVGSPELQVAGINSEGCIFGRMICKVCRQDLIGKVTVLTNCHECWCYPLIVGERPTCDLCGGLICKCGHCKHWCTRSVGIREALTESRH